MVKPIRKTTNKNPPILSHEFIIQNHADIVSCIAMVFVIGLMLQTTSPIASVFIALQYNATDLAANIGERILYSPGIKDFAGVFFYTLICIVIHAIIQEYVLDKVSKKLHLSKSKLAVFTTSGQLSIFYLISSGWGIDIAIKEHFIQDISRLWSDYPAPMPFLLKLYFIIQLSYRLHELPELYFQRVKRDEYAEKIIHSVASFALVTVPYFLNFNRLLVCLLIFHDLSEFIHHAAQLIQTVDKDEKFTKGTRLVSYVINMIARLASIILAVLTLWYGLALGEQSLDIQAGLFNTLPIRLAVLGGILLLQLYLTFNLISEGLAYSKESKGYTTVTTAKPKVQKKEKSKKTKKSDESDLPEVDQNTNKTLRNKQKVK